MKKIGIVDYYISEWHANNYPEWIRELNNSANTDFSVSYAWAEQDVSPVDGVTTAEWCAKRGIAQCRSIAELCEKSDAILILAPTNPEKHLPYAQQVLPCAKPTFVDKTFAPNAEEAKVILNLAKKFSTPMFSSSALRFASEIRELPLVDLVTVTGSGSNLEEYIVHLAEMVQATLGKQALRARASHMGNQRVFDIVAEDKKRATVLYAEQMPYVINGETADGRCVGGMIRSDFFKMMLSAILCFFESRIPPVSAEDTLSVMELRDLMLAAEKKPGEWIVTGVGVNKD